MSKVMILILIYNGLADTVECLEGLKKLRYQHYDLVIIDNNSSDHSADYLKEHCPEVTLIKNNENLGYAGGNNVGIAYFLDNDQYSHLLLLNNDIDVEPDLLDVLLAEMDRDPQIGVIGPLNYAYDERSKIIFNYTRLNKRKFRFEIFREALPGCDRVETGYVNGCCMLIKREVLLKIGGFRPEYFLYWEESDFCHRASGLGYRCVSAQRTGVYHKDGATAGSVSPLKMYYLNRNRLLFFRLNGMYNQKIYLYSLYGMLHFIFTQLKPNFGDSFRMIKTYVAVHLQAIDDFNRNKLGKREIKFGRVTKRCS